MIGYAGITACDDSCIQGFKYCIWQRADHMLVFKRKYRSNRNRNYVATPILKIEIEARLDGPASFFRDGYACPSKAVCQLFDVRCAVNVFTETALQPA